MKKILLLILVIIIIPCIFMFKAFADSSKEIKKGSIMSDKKILVAFFSATGTTEKLAQKVGINPMVEHNTDVKGTNFTGADIFEIQAEKPYTDADLDWRNNNSRSSLEMEDRNCRPAISSKVENMESYEVVFIGFPIWWYREPSIIDTFMESYDFTGKTVIPFATSGGSPIGNSGENMQKLASEAKVVKGRCFSVNESEEVLKKWASEWL